MILVPSPKSSSSSESEHSTIPSSNITLADSSTLRVRLLKTLYALLEFEYPKNTDSSDLASNFPRLSLVFRT
ncbi:unnamed protein product [Linum tenue]|uniref:Uncharacterized protein n=1 Tax=Linum tenue TaxID=586396 RepID=A0AAV0HTP6_9ROSI|nr:unnamed protein product [Linum tenue]